MCLYDIYTTSFIWSSSNRKMWYTLTQEMRFKLETPLFFLHYSKFRKFYMKNQNEIKENTVVIDKSKITNQNLFKEVTIKGNCQITLW